MVSLKINNQEVALPSDFTVDVQDVNTALDTSKQRSEYTYDIDIDLRDGDNAKLYAHVDRIGALNVPTGRQAVLRVDGLVVISGAEIFLKTENKVAKIQIVAEQSVVDIRANEQNIRELDLGRCDIYPENMPYPYLPSYGGVDYGNQLAATLRANPLEVPAVYVPLIVNTSEMTGNGTDAYRYEQAACQRNVINHYGSGALENANFVPDSPSIYGNEPSYYPWCPQPYFIVVIERVLQALGLEIKDNALRRMPFARNLLMVQAVEPRYINKMLPDWTVGEFIKEVERFFNVEVVVNSLEGTASIVSYAENVSGATYKFPMEDVIVAEGNPSREKAEGKKFFATYKRVGYDLPSNKYSHRASIDDSIMEKAYIVEDLTAGGIAQLDWTGRRSTGGEDDQHGTFDYPIIWKDPGTGTEWLISNEMYDTNKRDDHNRTAHALVRVNHLRPYVGDDSDGEIQELKIVPADVRPLGLSRSGFSVIISAPVATATCKPPKIAISDGSLYPDQPVGDIMELGINDWVDSGKYEKEDSIPERIELTQYLGICPPAKAKYELSRGPYYPDDTHLRTYTWPICINTRYMEGAVYGASYDSSYGPFYNLAYNTIMDFLWHGYGTEEDLTFDLRERVKNALVRPYEVNTDEIHNISIKHHGERLDVNRIFNIAGRSFLCISLKYRIRDGEFLDYAEGQFLPLL